MLRKPLLVCLCVVVWVLFCGVFLSVAETIVGLPVCCCVAIVIGVFLSVAETIVGSPVGCCVGIVLWNISWCFRNHCWFACVLLCWYCFVECLLVLRKLLLVNLCCCVGIVLWSVS